MSDNPKKVNGDEVGIVNRWLFLFYLTCILLTIAAISGAAVGTFFGVLFEVMDAIDINV